MLIDLEAELRIFIKTLVPESSDETVVEVVANTKKSRAERAEVLQGWLGAYGVLRFSNNSTIGASVIDFADRRQSGSLNRDKSLIVSEFQRLQNQVQPLLPIRKDGKNGQRISLVSKALWCCYPNDIPIWDDYASRSLQLLSRLCHFGSINGDTDYARHVDAWFTLYAILRGVIEHADAKHYPHQIRILDRFLWHLGQRNFNGS